MLGAALLRGTHQPRAQRAIARRFGLRDRRQVGGAGANSAFATDLGERPVAGATHLYAVAIGSNRPHGRSAARAASSKQRSPGSKRTSGCSTPRRSSSIRRMAAPAATSPMPSRWSKATLEPPADARALKAIEREFGRRPGRRWGPRVLDLDIVLWSGGQIALAPPDHPPPAPRRARASCSGRWPRSPPAGGCAARYRPPSRPSPCPPRPARLTAARRWAHSSVGRATDF